MNTIRLDKQTISEITDRLLSARKSNLKMVLDIAHRLESVEVIEGAEWLDDSKATSVEATRYSMSCIEEPIIWLLPSAALPEGGDALRDIVNERVKAIFFVEEGDGSVIEEFVDCVGFVQSCADMDDMVKEALTHSEAGDVILFSPAMRSNPEFEDYRERGRAFQSSLRATQINQ
jgi:UDP-N-acetylmuramoylalanine--D-glutamate ligase